MKNTLISQILYKKYNFHFNDQTSKNLQNMVEIEAHFLIRLIIFRGFQTLKLRFWAVFKLEMTLALLHIVNNTSKYTFLHQSPKTCRGPNVQSFTSVPSHIYLCN